MFRPYIFYKGKTVEPAKKKRKEKKRRRQNRLPYSVISVIKYPIQRTHTHTHTQGKKKEKKKDCFYCLLSTINIFLKHVHESFGEIHSFVSLLCRCRALKRCRDLKICEIYDGTDKRSHCHCQDLTVIVIVKVSLSLSKSNSKQWFMTSFLQLLLQLVPP